jgi:hypothetical protein
MAKQKYKEQRAKERVGVTLQLIVGEDDDLINAIISIPNGERQATLKNVLRQALGMPLPVVEVQAVAVPNEQEIYERLQQKLMADLEQRLNNPFVPPAPPSVETVDQIDQQTAIERKRRLSGANW